MTTGRINQIAFVGERSASRSSLRSTRLPLPRASFMFPTATTLVFSNTIKSSADDFPSVALNNHLHFLVWYASRITLCCSIRASNKYHTTYTSQEKKKKISNSPPLHRVRVLKKKSQFRLCFCTNVL